MKAVITLALAGLLATSAFAQQGGTVQAAPQPTYQPVAPAVVGTPMNEPAPAVAAKKTAKKSKAGHTAKKSKKTGKKAAAAKSHGKVSAKKSLKHKH